MITYIVIIKTLIMLEELCYRGHNFHFHEHSPVMLVATNSNYGLTFGLN